MSNPAFSVVYQFGNTVALSVELLLRAGVRVGSSETWKM